MSVALRSQWDKSNYHSEEHETAEKDTQKTTNQGSFETNDGWEVYF